MRPGFALLAVLFMILAGCVGDAGTVNVSDGLDAGTDSVWDISEQETGECTDDSDCAEGVCDTTSGTCMPEPTCTDGSKNGDETDIDCGGGCEPCEDAKQCVGNDDCVSGNCAEDGTCHPPTCDDQISNGDETDIDCGGSCPGCGEAMSCSTDDDCANGTCGDDGRCACMDGYAADASGACVNVDDCSPDPCQNGGTCADGIDSYTCACPIGYTGLDCETNVDDCSESPCQNGGTCTDEVDSYSCSCPTGFEGPHCETNIDDCSPNPCQNGGTCADGVDSYTCSCSAGYSGTDCETNIDDCSPNPCQNGGTCADGVDSYSCSCPTGFRGADCEAYYASCKALLDSGVSTSGEYTIDPDGAAGTPALTVFCDMDTAGGGWTIFHPDDIGALGVDVNTFTSDHEQVMFYLRRNDGVQFYTLAGQLPAYDIHDLTWEETTDYLRVNFIPSAVAANQGATQGFRSNGQDLTFTNCDGNGNSYLEFWQTGKSYSWNRDYTISKMWRDTKVSLPTISVSTGYFTFTAIHFGGCGTHSTSPSWQAYDGVLDAAMGVR